MMQPWGEHHETGPLSDIHSNRQALDACLQHARAHGADHFALLGDLVGYGADPAYVVQQAMDLVAAGYTVIGGNHDAFAVQPPQEPTRAPTAWPHRARCGRTNNSAPSSAAFGPFALTAQVGGCCWYTPAPKRPKTGAM